jgi:predicted secreted protein
MAFVHGRTSTLSIDGTAVTAYTDQSTLDRLAELAEVTVFGNDDKAYIGGLKGATVAASGSWDVTADAALWATFDGAVVAWAFSPNAGTTTFSGNALVTGYTITSGVGDKVSWSCSLTVSGAVGRA